MYGRVGVLADDGELAQCHACGRWFSLLANHVRQAHGMLPDEYRRLFGLRATTGLAGPRYKAYAEEKARRELAGYWGQAAERLRAMTREERSAYFRGRELRLESKLDPRNQETWRQVARRVGDQLRARYAAGTWAPPEPHDRAGALTKARARRAELLADPIQRERIVRAIAEARGRKKFVCVVCGRTFTRGDGWTGSRSCGQACADERRRQTAGARRPTTRPEVREKIRRRARDRQPDHARVVGALRAAGPEALDRLPNLEGAAVCLYYGFDADPLGLRDLAAHLGLSRWAAQQALARGVLGSVDLPVGTTVASLTIKECPQCGGRFAGQGDQTCCSPACSASARTPVRACCPKTVAGDTFARV